MSPTDSVLIYRPLIILFCFLYTDPCSSYATGTLAMPGVCSGYWTCANFRANASCCAGLNQRYVQGIGCMQDFSCTTPCPDDDSNKLVQPQRM